MDRSLLARATEGTDAPTPGYIYVDLAKAAGANPSAAQEMAQYLTRRLVSKQNPNIKYKCCKVIAKLCEQVPRNQFRRCVSQDPHAVAAIKEATAFRGPLDPVQGDAKNERVRQAAKEALDAVYSEAITTDATGGITPSYEPSPHYASSASSTSAGQPRRMEGMGNPRYPDPRQYAAQQPQNFKAVVKEAGEVIVGMIKDPLARNIDTPVVPRQGHSGNLPGYGNNNNSFGGAPPGAAELSRQTGGQWTMASNRGPGALQPPPNYGQDSEYYKQTGGYQWAQKTSGATATAGGVGGSWGNAAHSNPSINVVSTASATTGNAVADGSYEKSLIQELCPPGGMKPVPPPDKLASFARSVASLNPDLVCPALLDSLEDGQPWVIRAKALCVMEAAIQNGTNAQGHNPYRDFFHACRDEIIPLAAHPRAAIHEPARRVLALMGIDGPSSAPPPPPTAPAPNLLDFDDTTTTTAPAPSNETVSNANTSVASPSLFGGMQVKSKTPKVPPASDNLLDFADEPEETINDANTVFREPSSMFANLSVKEESKKMDNGDTGDITSLAAASKGSAFGFINETTSKESKSDAAPSAPEKPTNQSPQNQQTFDPLMNMTPNSQKKMMQLSPEQMRAMAYQQMMMQQQLQMQMMMHQQMPAQRPGMLPTMPQTRPANFSLVDTRPARKDDKKFDFVKDAMQSESSKK